jgi:Icc-related predicted phosphoesterase
LAVKIISDIHGAYEALTRQLNKDDTAVLLGDYVNLIDFRTMKGILSQVYSLEEIVKVLTALAEGKGGEVRIRIRDVAGADPERYARLAELVRESYHVFFSSIPCRCYILYGNTDDPELMREIAGERVEIVESGIVEIEGTRFGFVSGSPEGPWTVGLPGEMEPEEYARLVESVGPADVLCTHYPPAVPELTWDRLANRDEAGSEALLDYIDRYAPRMHYFGHVHNPRTWEVRRGFTRMVNAGFFKEHQRAILHSDEDEG